MPPPTEDGMKAGRVLLSFDDENGASQKTGNILLHASTRSLRFGSWGTANPPKGVPLLRVLADLVTQAVPSSI